MRHPFIHVGIELGAARPTPGERLLTADEAQ